MFDFEKLTVYQKTKSFNKEILSVMKTSQLDASTKSQLRRASMSVLLNIAEGSGRFTKPDRRNFFIISRSSIFECIAIIDLMKDFGVIENSQYQRVYSLGEEISKMLFSLISSHGISR